MGGGTGLAGATWKLGVLILRASDRGQPVQTVQLAGDSSVGDWAYESTGVGPWSTIKFWRGFAPAPAFHLPNLSLRFRSTRRIACSNHHATQTGGLNQSSADKPPKEPDAKQSPPTLGPHARLPEPTHLRVQFCFQWYPFPETNELVRVATRRS